MKISHKLCVRMDGTQFLWLWWYAAKTQSPQTFQPAVYEEIQCLHKLTDHGTNLSNNPWILFKTFALYFRKYPHIRHIGLRTDMKRFSVSVNWQIMAPSLATILEFSSIYLLWENVRLQIYLLNDRYEEIQCLHKLTDHGTILSNSPWILLKTFPLYFEKMSGSRYIC